MLINFKPRKLPFLPSNIVKSYLFSLFRTPYNYKLKKYQSIIVDHFLSNYSFKGRFGFTLIIKLYLLNSLAPREGLGKSKSRKQLS